MSKWILSLASVTMLALAMSGCGGSEGSSSVNDGGGSSIPNPDSGGQTLGRDFTGTPNQFGDTLPAVPMISELEN